MFRKILCLLLVVSLFGCASIVVPNYIKDESPYSQKFYGDYTTVLKITSDVMEEMGWKIAGTSDPLIYESPSAISEDVQHILVYTETKQMPWFLGTTYKKMNAYVRAIDEEKTEVELRYVRINSTFFFKFYGYKADRLTNRILAKIEEKLK